MVVRAVDVPVDPADVVARLVRTDLGELEAAAEVAGAVLPGDEAADPAPDVRSSARISTSGVGPGPGRVRACDGRGRGRLTRLISAPASCGTGTAAMSRSRIMSAETSSARAVKLGTMRWRRTSGASSRTSDGRT